MSNYQLGRRPHDPDRPVLKLANYLTSDMPKHPVMADYLEEVEDWGLYDNDTFGDCGPTALANQRKQVTRYLTGQEVSPTQEDVFDLYRRSGNPDFDPTTGAGDNGVVLADMLSAALKGGLGGVKPLAYAAVDPTNPDEVRAAVALFGSVIWGVVLDQAQKQQTDAGAPWDFERRSSEWGGHCVMAGAYTSKTDPGTVDLSVISWGQKIGTTDSFCGRQLEECYVVLWPELIESKEFEAGVNLSALAGDYEALTGKPFPKVGPQPAPEPEPEPVVPTPTPAPVPVNPVDTDAVFRTALGDFVGQATAWLEAQK